MADAPVFSVVIPVCNKWALTENCLRSLAEHTPEYSFEVIVADNGSSDATAGALPMLGRALFGARFHYIRFDENRSFGPACNAGAKKAAAPLLFFLNNDTLLTPGWAGPLVRALAEDSALGGVGPLLLYENDTVQHLGVAYTLSGVEHLYKGFPRDHPAVRRGRFVQCLTAAALMLRRDVFFQCGGFYEEYRNGFEDVDLCMHIVRSGKKLACIPDAVIYHLESQTVGRKNEDEHNGQVLFRRCKDRLRPDKHIHGLRDGFQPFVNDLFDIGLRLTEGEEAALAGRARGENLGFWLTLAIAHPFWVGGRERLAATLEESGYYEDALALRRDICLILMRAEACEPLLRTGARAGDAASLAEAEELCALFAANRRSRPDLHRALQKAREHEDALLDSLYEERLRELFP